MSTRKICYLCHSKREQHHMTRLPLYIDKKTNDSYIYLCGRNSVFYRTGCLDMYTQMLYNKLTKRLTALSEYIGR